MTEPDRDVLDDAFAALREEGAARDDDGLPAATRRALLAKTAARRRSLAITRWVMPFAAVFGAGVAWAAATGRLPLFAQTPEVVHEPPLSTPVPVPVPDPLTHSAAPEAPEASIAASPAPSAAARPPSNRDDALYRAAHEAHFVAQDWPKALAAWDAYLAAAPRGRFAPDARYNRAVVLVRLGRHDDARAALTPFADGTYGGYRQAEARELLDALP